MDKKLSATLTLTPEWTAADMALKDDARSCAIELRQFRMPDGEPITRAYKQLNGEILPGLASKSRGALLELARVLGRNTNNMWTFALTRVEQAGDEVAGLSVDQNRIQVLGLAHKRGAQTWFGKVCNSYGGDLQTSRLCGFTGLGWGKPQEQFLLVTVPKEGRAELEQLAERGRFELSKAVPRDPIINKQRTARALPSIPRRFSTRTICFIWPIADRRSSAPGRFLGMSRPELDLLHPRESDLRRREPTS